MKKIISHLKENWIRHGFKTLVLILLSGWIVNIYGQDQKVDSLKALVQGEEDTTQVNTLNELSNTLLNLRPLDAIKYGDMALSLADELDYGTGKAYALKNIGLGHYYLGDYLKVLDYWTQSLETFKALSDSTGIANMLNNLGTVYYTQGSDAKAMEFYLRSLKISEHLKDTVRITTAMINVAGIYTDNDKDYNKALNYFWQAGKFAKLYPIDNQALGGYLTGIGELYISMGNYDSALYYLEQSIPIYENTIRIPETLIRIGTIYIEKEEYEAAIKYTSEAFQIAKESDQKLLMTRSLLRMGDIYQKLEKSEEAFSFYREAESLAKEVGLYYELRSIYEGMSLTYAQGGSFRDAYEYNVKFQAINDTLFNLETDDKVRGLQFTYEIEKKQDQINILEKDSEISHLQATRQKAISIGAGITGFLLFLLTVILFNRYRYARKTKKIIEIEKDKSETLLLNILPSEVAAELKEKGESAAKDFEDVSVIFSDFKGFTSISEHLNAQELVAEINTCFKAFDKIITSYGIEKIKTIGDSYMAAGGLHTPRTSTIKDVIMAGLEMQAFMEERRGDHESQDKTFFEMRVGIHTGPVVAGIVGVKKFQYDIWGDTVNTASRMESSGEIGTVNISETTYNLVKEEEDLMFEKRGQIEAKNKGMVEMYFVKKVS